MQGSKVVHSSKHEVLETSPKGRFLRFKDEISSGSFKKVYRAVDNDTGCEVAWNVVKTSGLSKPEKERVRDEITMVQKLQHPNIIHFIKAWYSKEKEEVVLITEIMTGGSLKHYLKRIPSPHLRVIKLWCSNILSGLTYLHSQKPYPIVHRDLKCDNIFVSSSTSEVRIGDLGLSTFLSASYKESVLGTPHCMAPELFEGKYGTGVDIYAFGMCLLEMCTRDVPYSECKNPAEIYKKVTTGVKPMSLDTITDTEVKDFALQCLNPVDSRPSAEELLGSSFLVVDDTDQRVHKPVSTKQHGVAFPEPRTVKVWVSLGVTNKNTGEVKKTKIDFDYSLETDSPCSVAEEITEQLGLEKKHTFEIARTIQNRITECLASDNLREELSTCDSRSCNSSLRSSPLKGSIKRGANNDLF